MTHTTSMSWSISNHNLTTMIHVRMTYIVMSVFELTKHPHILCSCTINLVFILNILGWGKLKVLSRKCVILIELKCKMVSRANLLIFLFSQIHHIHSSPKVMAVFLFLIIENFLIGGMFSILETIKSDRSTLILQNKSWCQMINPMCTTFKMNCILQNQVCFERLISLSKTPYIFVKISKPRNWDPYSISAMSHGNRTSSYETVAHKLRPSVAFDWQYTPRQKLWPFPQT